MSVPFNETLCALDYLITYYSIPMYLLLFVVYGTVSILFIKHSNSFHPFFVLSFFLILLAYATSSFVLFFLNCIEVLMERNILFHVLWYSFTLSTNYIQSVVVLTLFERLIATILVNKYEKTKYWFSYLIAQVLCVAVAVARTFFSAESKFIKNLQYTISIVICIVLVILFTLNRKMTENSQAKLTLTTRYQLAENIKALRICVPFLLMDSFISIMFVISNLTTTVTRTFDYKSCANWDYVYIPFFFVFRTIAIIIQISMAISVIHHHESMKIWSPIEFFRRRRKVKSEDISMSPKKQLEIKNVLGKNICESETAENYFSQLHNQWDRHF